MPKIVLNRDGQKREYEVPDGLTFREAGFVKRMSGVRGAEINEALRAGDAELIAALTIIAVRRTGENITDDEILDMTVESLDLEPDEPLEEEADPTQAGDNEAGTSPEALADEAST